MTYTRDEMLDMADGHEMLADHVTAAMIRQLLAESEWQPIETAPRDGTPVDLLINNARIADQAWGPDGWEDVNTHEQLGANPTHWRPVPAPPKGGA
jgi:hypothetical protein